MLEVIAGKDPMDPRQGDVKTSAYTEALAGGVEGLRVGVVSEGFMQEGAQEDVNDSVRLARVGELERLGANVSEVSIPEHLDYQPVFFGISLGEATATFNANGLGFGWQGLYNEGLGSALGKFRLIQGDDLPPTLKVTLLTGTYMNTVYHGMFYAKAQNLRRLWRAAYDRALESFDVLVMPNHAHEGPSGDSGRGQPRLVGPCLGYAHQYGALQRHGPSGPEYPLRQVGRTARGFDAGGQGFR